MVRSRPFGTVTKLPSGRYRARYWELGRQVSAPWTFATKAEARVWLASVETDIARGELVDPAAGSVRFGSFADSWLEDRGLRPHTRATYRSQMQHILRTFSDVELNGITPAAVRRWHGQLLRSGLDRNTVAKVYRLFRTVAATAVEDGMLRSNPVGIKGAAVERQIERPLVSWHEVGLLADAIHPRFSALVWTAASSGLRFGELAALGRSNIDVASGRVRVERSLSFVAGRGATLGPPKSDAAHRSVVLPATVRDVLRAHVELYVASGDDALVFTTVTGLPLLNRYFAPHWRRAKAAADVDQSVRFHDLRHLAGTTAASSGASLREVMARMGHSSSDAALRYLKASERRDSEVASAIDLRIAAELRRS